MQLTPAQLRRRVEFWVKRLGALGLGHWRFTDIDIVDRPGNNDDSIASIDPSVFYDSVKMEFQTDELEEMDDRALDETIIHELLHLLWRDLDQYAENSLGKYMTDREASQWGITFNYFREQIIERTARTIYAEAMR